MGYSGKHAFIFFLIAGLILLAAGHVDAQNKPVDTKKQKKARYKAMPKYLITGYTFGYNKLRDTGTSPRFFEGNDLGLTLGYAESDSLKKFSFFMDAGFGRLTDGGAPEQFFWSGPVFHLQWAQEWMLKSFQSKKIKLSLGASLNTFMFFRSNEAFFNAGFGLDNINSLGLRAGAYFPFERRKPQSINLWLFNLKLNPRKYELSFLLDVPVINLATRPEYAYLTNVVDPETVTVDTYSFQLGGYQINTNLALKYYLYNGNAFQINYRWTALETSDTFNLNIARHRFSFSYYMRLNPLNRNEAY